MSPRRTLFAGAYAAAIDEARQLLEESGWSVRETNTLMEWTVEGWHGENRLLVRNASQAGAWRRAIQFAELSGLCGRACW